MQRHGDRPVVADDERGAVLLETAVTAGVFFTLIFFGCELLRLGYNEIMSQYAASRILRQAVTGRADLNYAIENDPALRADLIEDDVIRLASSLGLDLGPEAGNNTNVTICSENPNCTVDNAGTSESLLTLRISYPLRMFFGLGEYRINVIVVGKNEPFNAF